MPEFPMFFVETVRAGPPEEVIKRLGPMYGDKAEMARLKADVYFLERYEQLKIVHARRGGVCPDPREYFARIVPADRKV